MDELTELRMKAVLAIALRVQFLKLFYDAVTKTEEVRPISFGHVDKD